jgi:radical SAM protein with 4Fe4S-binding SPASM domain
VTTTHAGPREHAVPPLESIPLSRLLEDARAYETRLPLEGTLETTYRCNLACVHCYVNQPAGDAGERARELPLERLLRLVDEIADEGGLDLLLTGGEVLLRPDFPELYLHALRRGLRVTVFTNGTLVSERLADLFADYHPACVEVSVYGLTRETYERVTRVPGSWRRCLDGIRRLHARGVPLKLKTMALAWNRHELDGLRAFARELGVDFRHDSLLNPRVDCGANRNGELSVSAAEAVAADLDDPETRTRHERAHAELLLALRAGALAAPGDAEPVYTCGAGELGFTVDPYGRLQLCQLSRRNGFDLRDDSFARGWREHFPALRARTWQSDAVCRRCTLRGVCGNCPGAAELEHGDIEARVAQFCEITHLRAFELLGDACGHARDASCCRGDGRLAAAPEAARRLSACGGCAHEGPSTPPLIRLERRPARV